MMKVTVLDDWEEFAPRATDWSILEDRADITFRSQPSSQDPLTLATELSGTNILVMMRERTPLRRGTIEALPDLQLVVTTGVRNASLDLKACADHGVTVCHTTAGSVPVVELAWGLILCALHGIPEATERMSQGGWPSIPGRELTGATLGLVGLGRTGTRMATIARAFGMNVLAWSPNLTPDRAEAAGTLMVDKVDLFRRSDVVSLHLVLSDTTRHVVGREELLALGPASWLINTARAGLVDRAALLEVCRDHAIAGVAVDVFDLEPLPADDELRRLPHALLTPHIGYVTRENLSLWYSEVVEDIAAWLDGSPIRVLKPAR